MWTGNAKPNTSFFSNVYLGNAKPIHEQTIAASFVANAPFAVLVEDARVCPAYILIVDSEFALIASTYGERLFRLELR
jgi:hypothetical protein